MELNNGLNDVSFTLSHWCLERRIRQDCLWRQSMLTEKALKKGDAGVLGESNLLEAGENSGLAEWRSDGEKSEVEENKDDVKE